MEEKHKLAEEISATQSLQLLATAYEEISVMKMRVARDSVLHTRLFLASLLAVFVNVKNSYVTKLQKQNKATTQDMLSMMPGKPKQQIYVLLSASNKLYGDIVVRTFDLFKQTITKNPNGDIVVIGRTGKDLYDEAFPNRPYTFFDLPDIIPNIDALKQILQHILDYQKITVFYGSFVNILTQEVVATTISGDLPLHQAQSAQHSYDFIFEPSIEELLKFFETQISSSLFKQTIAEEELARLASRIKTMEQAIVFINTRIANLTLAERRAKRQIDNRKQLERLAGMRLWNH